MKYFGMVKKANTEKILDVTLLVAGGLGFLIPDMVSGILGFALGPVTLQMLFGALMIARVVDKFVK